MWEVGLAKVDASVYEPGIAMMGWGQMSHQAWRVAEPLHARAFVAHDPEAGRSLGIVLVDVLAMSKGVWLEVIGRIQGDHPELGLGPANLAILATHTHSGPSGFAHHFWMQLNAPGFSPVVHDALVDALVASLVQAWEARAPSRLVLVEGEVPREAGVAYNRSWFAYSRNPDVLPVGRRDRDRAVHRTMTMVRVDREDGTVAGLVDWFGLHATCMHADHDGLHPDHKGLAAKVLEDANPGLVALMAQECCGDITPNHRPDPVRGHTQGSGDDDHESVRIVAEAQAAVARELLTAEGVVLDGPIEAVTRFVHMPNAPADARFTVDGRAHRTRGATLGMSMTLGTAEGPGPTWPVRRWFARFHAARRGLDRALGVLRPPRHDPKLDFVDLQRGADSAVLGLLPVRHMPAVDPIFAWVRDRVRDGSARTGSWFPTDIPVQLLRLGPLVVVTVPFEPTTVSGRRLRQTVLDAAPEGVRHVVVSPYANAYMGYLTTAEEYQAQHYEAGYTIHGPHTLAALQTAVDGLARRLGEGEVLEGEVPSPRPREALERVRFREPWPTLRRDADGRLRAHPVGDAS